MQRPLRTAHARIWTVLAVVLPIALLAILAIRQTAPEERPAVELAGEADDGEAGR
jgi:hypothetical protein